MRRRIFGAACADVAELADAPDLGSGPVRGGGSTPSSRTEFYNSVLRFIRERGKIKSSEITKIFKFTRSRANQLVKPLVDAGIVTCHSKGDRVKSLSLFSFKNFSADSSAGRASDS